MRCNMCAKSEHKIAFFDSFLLYQIEFRMQRTPFVSIALQQRLDIKYTRSAVKKLILKLQKF